MTMSAGRTARSGPADRFAADVLTTLDQHPADAILAETVAPGILIGAEAVGLPTAALMANIYARPTAGLPMLGTGWRPASGPLGRIRDRLAVAFVRRIWSTILPESTVVITHAGHGTVLKALAAGVPLVCVPMGRDQRDNTTRVLRLGAGVRVSKNAGPRRIAAAVRRVFDRPEYAQAAGRFAVTLAEEAATRPTAVDEVEALLGDHPPRSDG